MWSATATDFRCRAILLSAGSAMRDSGTVLWQEEGSMVAREDKRQRTKVDSGALLYVTDCVNDNQESLEYACKLADKNGAYVELLHVVDPEKTASRPDAQMGIQYSLEALARSLKTLGRQTHALILFGCPEDAISKRASDIKATLIALPLNGSASDRIKKILAKRLTVRCACPVLTFSPVFPDRNAK